MAKESPAQLLEQFRKNKHNRKVEDWVQLLRSLGWTIRKATKEGFACQHGSHTLTLVKPGSTVYPYLATRILREIDLVLLEKEALEDE
jgi:hypothetical protein